MLEKFNLASVLVGMAALVFCICFHGFVQALVADRLGDRTPREAGFLTLNPLPHFDLLGTLVFPAIGILLGGYFFGWGKLVPFQAHQSSRKFRMKTSISIFSGSGILSYLLLSIISTIIISISIKNIANNPLAYPDLFRSALQGPGSPGFLGLNPYQIFILAVPGAIIKITVLLAAFNLIPIGMLDGAGLLRGFVPDRHLTKYDYYRTHPYAFVVFLILGLTGMLSIIINPISDFIFNILLHLAQLILGA